MVGKLKADGHDVIAWNRSEDPGRDVVTIRELAQKLQKPRVFWLMLPAGEATNSVLAELTEYLEKDDVVIDGGNAHFKDTQKRYEDFKAKGVRFLGVGVSGGIIAAEKGYPLMVGGDESAYQQVKPVLHSLSEPHGGYDYFGEGGAGHYIKMVHNAIEYGYMQSIGEGFGVLQKAEYNLDLVKVAKIYQKGTLISGFMMDRTVDALEDPEFSQIQGVIGKASGETIWTVEEAKKMNVPIEIIEASLEFRNRSEEDTIIQQSFAAKLVSALRKAFGGHKVTK